MKDRCATEQSRDEPADNRGLPAELQATPARHQFPLGIIQLFLNFVLKAASSQRCAAEVLRLFGELLPDFARTPCPNTGRLWLQRFGLYALTTPKEKADDWVWIMRLYKAGLEFEMRLDPVTGEILSVRPTT